MDKEDVVCDMQWNTTQPESENSVVTFVEVDGTVLSEISQRKANADDITYMWTLKNTTKLLKNRANRCRE